SFSAFLASFAFFFLELIFFSCCFLFLSALNLPFSLFLLSHFYTLDPTIISRLPFSVPLLWYFARIPHILLHLNHFARSLAALVSRFLGCHPYEDYIAVFGFLAIGRIKGIRAHSRIVIGN